MKKKITYLIFSNCIVLVCFLGTSWLVPTTDSIQPTSLQVKLAKTNTYSKPIHVRDDHNDKKFEEQIYHKSNTPFFLQTQHLLNTIIITLDVLISAFFVAGIITYKEN